MKFTRNKGMFLAVVAITFAMFNTVVFTLPFFRQNANFWTGYVFSTLAILIAAGAGLYALGREGGMKSKFYGLPLLYLAWSFFIVQMIGGLIMMVLPAALFPYGLVANVLIMGVYSIGFIAVNVSREFIENADASVETKIAFVKSMQADVESLAARASDETLKKNLTALAEAVRYSDPMSSPRLADMENDIRGKAAMLKISLSDIDAATAIVGELQQMIADRNRQCKILK